MKVVISKEMRDLDEKAISEVGIPSVMLMENAGLQAAQTISRWIIEENFTGEILIFCGKGKNGGDGLVTARHLLTLGHKVRTFLCNDRSQYVGETGVNLKILENLKARITVIDSISTVEEFFKSTNSPFVVVDAILGIGLDRDVDGLYYEVIEVINERAHTVFSLDIPSGVMADSGHIANIAINATATVSFGYPKVGHFLPPGAAKRGKLFNVNLGFPRKWGNEGSIFLLTHENIIPLISGRDRFGHKNTFGHCLLLGGSPGRLGAIVLAARSALKMGAGLVTVASWEDSFPALEGKLPSEIMTSVIKKDFAPFLDNYSTVIIGPGLGVRPEGAEVLKFLINNFQSTMVIDADGLNLISEYKLHDLILRRRAQTILTPHPGEMARLLGVEKQYVTENPIACIEKAVDLTGAVVALKGASTLIHSQEGVTYFNHHPNDGMAKAGSGDILAGMLGGLVGQKLDGLIATRLGVFVHSLAGKCAAIKHGERSMSATNIIENIDEAYTSLLNYQQKSFKDATEELV